MALLHLIVLSHVLKDVHVLRERWNWTEYVWSLLLVQVLTTLSTYIIIMHNECMALQDAVNVLKDSSALQFYLLTV